MIKPSSTRITASRSFHTLAALVVAAVVFLFASHGYADDQPANIELDFGTVIVQAANAFQLNAEVPAEEAPQGIEFSPIGGGAFGGIELPENFKQVMKSAQEMQAIKQKYDATISQLIEEAKKLEDPSGIMAAAAKVAELARVAEQLKTDIEAKQKEMRKHMGGGIGVFGGEAGEIEIGGFGGEGGPIEILPVFPMPK